MTAATFDRSVGAMRDIRAGSDRWELADALLDEVGPGDSRTGFVRVRAAAESAGVEPLSISALRQYRDVAARWPVGDRVPGVSFSAHRAALTANDPGDLLRTLADAHGAGAVTVSRVKAAVAVTSGSGPTTPAPAPGTAPGPAVPLGPGDLFRELRVAVTRDRQSVLGVITGTTRDVLADLVRDYDAAQSSAGAKSAAWTVPAPKPTGTPTPAPKPTGTPTRRPGDVRGL